MLAVRRMDRGRWEGFVADTVRWEPTRESMRLGSTVNQLTGLVLIYSNSGSVLARKRGHAPNRGLFFEVRSRHVLAQGGEHGIYSFSSG